MMKFVKRDPEQMGWYKRPGPPKVWRVVDGRKKTADGKIPKFSIQEIPEDRYNDVLDHMCNIFIRDEAMCTYLDMAGSPEAISDFCSQWNYALQQGVVTGAFLVDENNPKPVLAGVAMTAICNDATARCFDELKFTSDRSMRMIAHLVSVGTKKNVRELYNADELVDGYGLSVDPRYRGQGLAYQLVRAREDIGKAYNVHATSSVFTSPFAVKAATHAGWETLVVVNFEDTKNSDGTESFPGIPIKSCTLMGKHF